jgi:hypothetical protein
MSDAELEALIFAVSQFMFLTFNLLYHNLLFVCLYDNFSDRPLYNPLTKFHYRFSV